ncbi:gamma-glutamylcyclotransferase [Amaricoccus solimangrovi]|uniref:glutathione-specific gamma-glutamylcyclotransferase n=1 Tax=Amaricoccus solimangrovi TaxID=2589815 RepID=A0A501X1E9_9RHOB|nr:gamma-glutamylcyclotransferase [Amaricoccus solimangrovi]
MDGKREARTPVWIFAYGSLIWKPGFDFAERALAEIVGYRRGFCMTSIHYRGTPEAPGLVLALDADPAGRCSGVAYRLPPETSEAGLAYVRERELVSRAYDEARLPLRLDDGREVDGYVYVVNRDHAQYRGGLTPEQQAEVIARAEGPMGTNAEYLVSTVASLAALGLEDPELVALAAMVRARRGDP